MLIEDVHGDSQRQDFDNFAEGIDVSGNVHDVVFRRCTVCNSQQTREPTALWNGDGFTCERNTYDIVFEDCVASGNTDARFDLKSSRVTLLRCKSFDNAANFKLWGKEKVVMRECTSEEPHSRGGSQSPKHLTATWGGNVLVENCTFIDQNPRAVVFHTEANDRVKPPVGSTITVLRSRISGAGRRAFVDLNSKVVIDGAALPFEGRGNRLSAIA